MKMSEIQRKQMFAMFDKEGIDHKDVEQRLGFSVKELDEAEAQQIIECMRDNGDLGDLMGSIIATHEVQRDAQKTFNSDEGFKTASEIIEQKQETAIKKAEPEKQPPAKTPEPKFTTTKGSEMQIAISLGLPEEAADMFFMKLSGKPYIKVAGLQYIAGRQGYQRIQISEPVYDKETETWSAEAMIYPKLTVNMIEAISRLAPDVQAMAFEKVMEPTNGFGTASKKSVQMSTMHPFLKEMAQTRALGRALRSYTGYGATVYEEMPQAQVEVD